jgi:type VI secretion system secreted protein VgrG
VVRNAATPDALSPPPEDFTMALKQDPRFLTIATPLGDDVLVAQSVTINEGLGRLFSIEAELLSEDGNLKFTDILGQNVTLGLVVGQKEQRFFNGIVSRFIQVGNKMGLACYRAEIVPWLWFLTRTADCRIFQEKTIPEIIEDVFKGHGFNDYKLSLNGSYEKREYCVQYRETDFNFVSRLMEAAGIYYFVEHENGKHTVVLADATSAHTPYPGYDSIAFKELERGAAEAETITDWVVEHEVQPVAYAVNDFDPLKPKTSLLASSHVTREHGLAKFEIFDYPGEYVAHGEGTHLSEVRLAELQSLYCVARGVTTARGVATGRTFTMTDHPREDQNKEYLVTSTSIVLSSGALTTGKAGGDQNLFSCRFTVLATSQTFRPSRVTPKPVVQGPQTAMVVGKKGEEIDTDKYGRVKLQFHWDRHGKADENSSCWTRVSQGWAGKQWGAITIPRIGQEVIVEFLEGDPDRPIVTGRVYNADAMPPYALPDEKTKSTVKSNSSKGGEGFNEIRFEDKKDSEQVFIQAQKDMDERVLNDSKEWIGHDRHLIVKNDQVESVENDRQEKVKRDHVEEIGRDRHLMIKGKEAIEVAKTLSLKVGEDVGIDLGMNLHTKVKDDVLIEAKNIVLKASDNITLKIGEDEVYIAMDKKGIKFSASNGDFKFEAMNIESKASADFKVEATANASVKGTAGLKLESPATAEMKSAQTTVKGDGMLTLKGGMTMIN